VYRRRRSRTLRTSGVAGGVAGGGEKPLMAQEAPHFSPLLWGLQPHFGHL